MKTKPTRWTENDLVVLRRLYPRCSQREMAILLGRPRTAIASKAKMLRIRRIRPNYRPWTTAQTSLLRRLYPHRPTAEVTGQVGHSFAATYGRAHKLGLAKTEAYLASPEACRLRRGDNVGAAWRFRPGHVPANKGLRRPGWARGRMAQTQFQPGNRPQTWVPIGSTRLMQGYLQRKITDTGYSPRDWVGVHVLLWVKAHGPVPPGHVVAFRDGNKRHIALDNLELISRRELMSRNTIHHLPPELKQTIKQLGLLRRRIRKTEEAINAQK